jgi:hypothetical protein
MPPTRRPKDNWKAAAANGAARPAAAGRSGRWLAAALLLAALAGVTAGLFVYLRPDPDPVLLALPVTQYAHPDWPPNPWAEADARGLRDRFGGDSAQAVQVQEKARIVRELNRAADDSRGGRRPVVIYVSALGVAADGKVSLLPGDARPDDPAGWLPLDDLLQPLRRTDAPRLLVLDVRPVASPRTVLPTEDVNEALDAALARLDQAGDLPFFVLTANTPAAGPTVIRPLKRTAFGLAQAQAAGGAADGWNPSRSKDGRVSSDEFTAYVREVTHAASVAYGHAPQLPRLHGKGTTFFMLHVPGSGPVPVPTAADADPYPDWLRDGWKDRDAWVKDGLPRRAPRLVHHVTLAATRAEQRWLAGLDPKAVGDQFLPVANDLRETAKPLRPPVPLVRSVARVRTNPAVDVKAAEAALRPVFDKVREPAGVKKEELAGAMQAAWAKPADAAPFDATAAALFGFALGLEDPTFEQVRYLAQLAAGFRPRPRHPELLALDLLAGLPPELSARWPAGTVRTFLTTARAAEDAAVFDGRSLPWVRGKLEEADRARWQAVKTLCDPESPDADLRAAAADLDRVRQAYTVVRDATDALATARAEYEATRAGVVDLAVAFLHELAPVPEAVAAAWAGLVEDVLRLQVLLRPPPEPRLPPLDELGRVAQAVRANRERLRGLIRVPEGAGPRQLEAALRWPWWTLPERTALLARLDATSREATGRVLSAWPLQPSGQEPAAPPRWSARVAADSARDVRRMVDLVRLADGPDAADLVAKAEALGATPAAPDVAVLVRRARAAWRTGLPDQYRAANPTNQALVGWAVDPDDVPAAPRPGIGYLPNPELADERAAERAVHVWLGDFRCKGEAAAVRGIDLKAARDHAAALDALARDFLDWTP